jgi:hypothetical protein
MKEPMTLIERLRNPTWVGAPNEPALLDVELTLSLMREAADKIAALTRVVGEARPWVSFAQIRGADYR